MSPEDLLAGARRVLLVHAHPDDETLATGGLIAELADRGVEVFVLTATRGELGQIVPGTLGSSSSAELSQARMAEVVAAARALGVRHGTFLGAADARAFGRALRQYTDSGMAWLDAAETLAGPGDQAGPDALSLAAPDEIAADIAAYARGRSVDAIVSYDAHGGYGHPDHVALHEPSQTAARMVGVPFWELCSDPDAAGVTLDTPHQLARVKSALAHHASQLTVDGDEVVHVGGQRQPITLRFTLRCLALSSNGALLAAGDGGLVRRIR